MIREATGQDAGEIANIYNYYIHNTVITFEESEVSPRDIVSRIEKVNHVGLPWLVAESEGKLIGYAYATRWNERSAYKHSVETAIYLSHTLLAKGWGTRLYEVLFARLRQMPVHVIIGGMTLPNPASKALHEKFGMKKVAHFERVGFKFDKWLDVGYWQMQIHK